MALLEKAKAVCRVTSTAFDDEIGGLIGAALADMSLTDIDGHHLVEEPSDPLIIRAVMTYVGMNFKLSNGQVDSATYDRLKESYDEQKKQLLMSSKYSFGGVS